MDIQSILAQSKLTASILFVSTLVAILLLGLPQDPYNSYNILFITTFLTLLITIINPIKQLDWWFVDKIQNIYNQSKDEIRSTLYGYYGNVIAEQIESKIYTNIGLGLGILVVLTKRIPGISNNPIFNKIDITSILERISYILNLALQYNYNKFIVAGHVYIFIILIMILIALFLNTRSYFNYINGNAEIINSLVVFENYRKPIPFLDQLYENPSIQLQMNNKIIEIRLKYIQEIERYLQQNNYTSANYLIKNQIISTASHTLLNVTYSFNELYKYKKSDFYRFITELFTNENKTDSPSDTINILTLLNQGSECISRTCKNYIETILMTQKNQKKLLIIVKNMKELNTKFRTFKSNKDPISINHQIIASDRRGINNNSELTIKVAIDSNYISTALNHELIEQILIIFYEIISQLSDKYNFRIKIDKNEQGKFQSSGMLLPRESNNSNQVISFYQFIWNLLFLEQNFEYYNSEIDVENWYKDFVSSIKINITIQPKWERLIILITKCLNSKFSNQSEEYNIDNDFIKYNGLEKELKEIAEDIINPVSSTSIETSINIVKNESAKNTLLKILKVLNLSDIKIDENLGTNGEYSFKTNINYLSSLYTFVTIIIVVGLAFIMLAIGQ